MTRSRRAHTRKTLKARPIELVVPAILGVATEDWTDLPPAGYPVPVVEQVILPRLEAGEDLIRLDGYLCGTCNGLTLTYDRHPGVAPSHVDHRRFDPDTRCSGVAVTIGRPVDLTGTPSHEWYRPSEDVLLTLGDAAINHVLSGGLLLRPIALPTHVDPELLG